MGDRCYIIADGMNADEDQQALYLHSMGDARYVKPILMYCKLRGFRWPEDDEYGWAYLCQVACNYNTYYSEWDKNIHTGMSVGMCHFAPGEDDKFIDNGYYFIRKWDVVRCSRQSVMDEYLAVSDETLINNMIEIDNSYAEKVRVGEDAIREFVAGGCVQKEYSGYNMKYLTNN